MEGIIVTNLSAEFIRGVRLFQNLSHEEVQELLDASEEVNYKVGQAIFDEGDEGRALYVVIEGSVRISLAATVTTETELVTVEQQGVFGESSFFHRSVHHATATCLTPVRVIRLQRDKYRELLKSDNLAAYKLAANAADLLGERLQQTDEWIERMLQGRKDAEQLAKWKKFRRGFQFSGSAPTRGFGL